MNDYEQKSRIQMARCFQHSTRTRLLALIAVCVWSTTALAQDAEADPAREQFERGVRALQEGRASEARDLLERSLEAAPRSSVAYNLALSHRELGQPTRAVDVLARLLEGAYGDVPDAMRVSANELLERARADVGTIVVDVVGPERATVSLDGAGETTAATAAPFRYAVDPGLHRVAAQASGFDAVETEITIEPGAVERVRLMLRETAPPARSMAPAQSAPREVDEGGGSGWVWAGVGAGVLLAAGAVVAIVLLAQPDGFEVDPVFANTAVLAAW